MINRSSSEGRVMQIFKKVDTSMKTVSDAIDGGLRIKKREDEKAISTLERVRTIERNIQRGKKNKRKMAKEKEINDWGKEKL